MTYAILYGISAAFRVFSTRLLTSPAIDLRFDQDNISRDTARFLSMTASV